MSTFKQENERLVLEKINLPDNAVVFDVGCNYGDYTFDVINVMGDKNYTVHCFEPVKDFYEAEKERFADTENIKLNNFALSDSTGSIPFCRITSPNRGMEGCSSFILRPEFVQNKWPYTMTKIETKTIDDYIQENNISHIHWLKIDVEGVELFVLKGGREMLSNQIVDMIQFEYGSTFKDAGISMDDVKKYLSGFNYCLRDFIDGEFVPMDDFVDDYEYNNYYIFNKNVL